MKILALIGSAVLLASIIIALCGCGGGVFNLHGDFTTNAPAATPRTPPPPVP